ncbi:RsmB/NOP family class I SAM-dependent RNA methyltransferase [Blastochloris viridis]|uniref:Ribosomal RNA small subunit methyltransferase B n=1 Tax=Blastochloris viridis TaxID=1079 RepID=A0A0H5BEC0_BLAVI|nr:RsmB/NOP family class I SAM-dependent RNA methyltransferase [Blastochloris viridis]ALK08039.1 Ribosomal RNA small subunit methyltransferase B [Blastochloris viridis]BAR98701.1 Sun protein [Blastochloris viridis]CUU43961.1 Ribosomal RNA small subunit methyltransferase B [Blastochloris viridis]
MTPSARIEAAIAVLTDIDARRRPAADALKDWGLSHRFAGSGDRAAIAGLAYDALRRKASAAWLMAAETPRAAMIGMLRLARELDVAAIDRLFDGVAHGPAPLTDDERQRLASTSLDGAPPWVAGDYPEWLDAPLAAAFGAERVEEGRALAARAPLDLRVNSLKADRDDAMAALAHFGATETRWSPDGLRIKVAADGKSPAVQAEPCFVKGLIEIQDEGSQLAALLSGAAPGEQVLDLCAGGGGKTLALAAAMANRGQVFAFDTDSRRLAPIFPRLERAGTRNVQVRAPKGPRDVLADLAGHMDLVVIDAPCTGTGTWRRNPDAKWRLRPGALAQRTEQQAELLDQATRFVKPGGRIAYVTCSLLPEENDGQIEAFLARHPGWRARPPAEVAAALGERAMLFLKAVRTSEVGLTMTPARTDTDGFFVALITREG